ncbi:MAG TPA: hypothetical protein VLB76_26740 [Thermoanaerobaculia bacterium]|jgi:hypothetical protein|nr:hypothetical protein [Thermoanaerobaculia bacterium]
MTLTRILFPLGRCVATPGALEVLSEAKQAAVPFLTRHQEGDWGEVSPEDKAANTLALVTGERILSAYRTAQGAKLWIITEADRSSTCILLPEEY